MLPKRSKLRVAYRSIPKIEDLDFAVVRTLDVHEVLILLGGGPVFSYGDYLEKVYADALNSSHDYRTWWIRFKRKAKFSDGSLLEASHWYHSVARAIRVGAGVHFNPRRDVVGAAQSKDGYCEGLSLEGDIVKIQLIDPNKNFPRLIGKIEASVLPIHSASVERLELTTMPSSGPYQIKSYNENEAVFEINKNFPGHRGRAAYSAISVVKLDDLEACHARIRDEVDFVFPMGILTIELRKELLRTSQIYRDFAHTVFVSFRAQSSSIDNPRPWSSNASHRRVLAKLLKSIPEVEGLEKCSTLLAGKGLGRLEDGPSYHDPIVVTDLPKLTLSAVERPDSQAIVEHLSKCGVVLSVTWVKSFNELFSGDALHTDAFVGWNDFCGKDPYISLYNALNPDRALFLDDGNFKQVLSRIQMEDDLSKKDYEYQELHLKILQSASAIPVFTQWFDAYASQNLNVALMKGGILWTLGPNK